MYKRRVERSLGIHFRTRTKDHRSFDRKIADILAPQFTVHETSHRSFGSGVGEGHLIDGLDLLHSVQLMLKIPDAYRSKIYRIEQRKCQYFMSTQKMPLESESGQTSGQS